MFVIPACRYGHPSFTEKRFPSGRDITTVANVWNPVLLRFTCVSDFVYQLEAIILIAVKLSE
jgi:hypothetical protein